MCVVLSGLDLCLVYQLASGHADSGVGRLCAKFVYDAPSGRHAQRNRSCFPGSCHGHADAGHLGLAFGFVFEWPFDSVHRVRCYCSLVFTFGVGAGCVHDPLLA